MKGHIRKRGKGWQIIVYLGNENGKKKYFYKTIRGTKGEAKKALKDIIYQVENGLPYDYSKMTFGEYLKIWLQDYCAVKLAPSTYKRYKQIIELHIIPELGKIKLKKLHPLNIQRYYKKALASGRIGLKNKERKGLSPTTVLYHHRVIHKALAQAVRWQILDKNVADGVEPPKKEHVEFETIDIETFIKILNIAREKYPAIALPILLAGVTGMRRGEALGLRWEDVDLENGRIYITHQLQRIDGTLRLTTTKTKRSNRPNAMPEFLIKELKRQKVEQNKNRLLSRKKYNPLNLICTWEDGRPVDPDYVTKKFHNIIKSLGLNIRFHDLRHSFATLLLSKKIHPKIVSEMLGHSSIGITLDTYSHVLPSMQDEVVKMIDVEIEKHTKN